MPALARRRLKASPNWLKNSKKKIIRINLRRAKSFWMAFLFGISWIYFTSKKQIAKDDSRMSTQEACSKSSLKVPSALCVTVRNWIDPGELIKSTRLSRNEPLCMPNGRLFQAEQNSRLVKKRCFPSTRKVEADKHWTKQISKKPFWAKSWSKCLQSPQDLGRKALFLHSGLRH